MLIQLQIKPKTHLNNYVSTIGNLHSFIWPCIMWYVFFSVCLVVFTRSVQISWPDLIRAFYKNRSGLWDVICLVISPSMLFQLQYLVAKLIFLKIALFICLSSCHKQTKYNSHYFSDSGSMKIMWFGQELLV